MKYKLLFTEYAEGQWHQILHFHREDVKQELIRLSEAPVTLSRPAVSPPYPPGRQMYSFNLPDPVDLKVSHQYTILFRYGTDEETLVILGIGHSPLRYP